MKNTTFKDEKVGKLLTEQFYFVSFDGESKEDVTFLGRTFRFKPSGRNTGVHELAEQLGTKNGQLTYPSLVFLSPQYDILYQYDGFLSARQTRKILEKLIELKSQGQ
jgi:thioredoxin-related protein